MRTVNYRSSKALNLDEEIAYSVNPYTLNPAVSYVDEVEAENQQLKREIKVLWECFKRLKEDKK